MSDNNINDQLNKDKNQQQQQLQGQNIQQSQNRQQKTNNLYNYPKQMPRIDPSLSFYQHTQNNNAENDKNKNKNYNQYFYGYGYPYMQNNPYANIKNMYENDDKNNMEGDAKASGNISGSTNNMPGMNNPMYPSMMNNPNNSYPFSYPFYGGYPSMNPFYNMYNPYFYPQMQSYPQTKPQDYSNFAYNSPYIYNPTLSTYKNKPPSSYQDPKKSQNKLHKPQLNKNNKYGSHLQVNQPKNINKPTQIIVLSDSQSNQNQEVNKQKPSYNQNINFYSNQHNQHNQTNIKRSQLFNNYSLHNKNPIPNFNNNDNQQMIPQQNILIQQQNNDPFYIKKKRIFKQQTLLKKQYKKNKQQNDKLNQINKKLVHHQILKQNNNLSQKIDDIAMMGQAKHIDHIIQQKILNHQQRLKNYQNYMQKQKQKTKSAIKKKTTQKQIPINVSIKNSNSINKQFNKQQNKDQNKQINKQLQRQKRRERQREREKERLKERQIQHQKQKRQYQYRPKNYRNFNNNNNNQQIQKSIEDRRMMMNMTAMTNKNDNKLYPKNMLQKDKNKDLQLSNQLYTNQDKNNRNHDKKKNQTPKKQASKNTKYTQKQDKKQKNINDKTKGDKSNAPVEDKQQLKKQKIKDNHPLKQLRSFQSHGKIRIGCYFQASLPNLVNDDRNLLLRKKLRDSLNQRLISAITF